MVLGFVYDLIFYHKGKVPIRRAWEMQSLVILANVVFAICNAKGKGPIRL